MHRQRKINDQYRYKMIIESIKHNIYIFLFTTGITTILIHCSYSIQYLFACESPSSDISLTIYVASR